MNQTPLAFPVPRIPPPPSASTATTTTPTPTPTTSNTSTTTPTSAPSARPPYPHIRSCLSCRHRKVKCDRQRPCSNCDRAGSECVFPPGPGRAPKKPRGTRDPRLLERLWKLEDIVCRLGAELDPEDLPPDGPKSPRDPANRSIDQEFGRLLIDETRSCYVSNRFWASLGDEIEELRDLLHQPWSDEDECSSWAPPSHLDQPSLGLDTSSSLLGYRALSHSLRSFHPPFSQLILLLEFFKENVAPLVRIFHMPSMIQVFWNSIASLDSLDKDTEALMFTIYYAAIISLTPEQCESQLGEPRPAALAKYRFAVEQALARANLLNTQSVVLIQASVLFLSALRNEDDSRTVWSMTALTFHLAQAMGLHRDGTAFGLKPFETEIRRRIWWHICLLDARSSEDHGCEPIVHDGVFDTRMPLNVNDCDLSPQMTAFPDEKEEATEMTFCLIRCQVTRAVRRIGYAPPGMRGLGPHHDRPSPESRSVLMGELQRLLEERYLRYCDPSVSIFLVAATVARLIIARMWLAVHYPNSHKDAIASSTRDRLFAISVEVIELSTLLLTNQDLLKWNWYFKTHFQWHAMAFVLSEICSRPPSDECDRAWEYVTAVYERWETKDKERQGNLGRPMGRLMAKARKVREMQRTSILVDGQWAAHPAHIPGDSSDMTYSSENYPILPVAAADELADTPMEQLPRDPLFGGMDTLWAPDAPMGLEPGHGFNAFPFDPGFIPAIGSGEDLP